MNCGLPMWGLEKMFLYYKTKMILEPVTPCSSDEDRSCSPPAYEATNGYHQGYELRDEFQNNNYVSYEDNVQDSEKMPHFTSYSSGFSYQPQLTTHQMENSPPHIQSQLTFQMAPSALDTRAHQPSNNNFGSYGNEIYKPYEEKTSVSSGVAQANRCTIQQQNEYQPSTTALNDQSDRTASVSQKRARTQFTSLQLVEMEREFNEGRYLSRAKRINLAQKLHLTEKQIKVWFQNRRMKFNRDNKVSKHIKHSKTLSPESSYSSAGSPNADANRPLGHSPMTKYSFNPPLNNSGTYQGFSASQVNDYPYHYNYNYTHTSVSPDSSSYAPYSLYNNPSSYYPSSSSLYASSFSSLPSHANPQVSRSAFQLDLPQAVKRENVLSPSHEYPPNVTVLSSSTGNMIELQELK